MHIYPVTGPCMVDPMWFSRVRHGRHQAEVAADGSVTVDGVVLRLRGDAPAAGTAVQVWLSGSGFFVCAARDEIEREAQSFRDAEAVKVEQRRQQFNALRAEAEAFNSRIVLPVLWDVGIKDVLSGLSATSWGDGRSKATVEHVYLLEELQAGRLKRRAGDFLCTAASGKNGKRWSTIVVSGRDGDGHRFQPKVTCKACLAQAQRLMQARTEERNDQ